MKIKIKLSKLSNLADILRVFEKVKASRILFVCSREFRLVADAGLLNRIKAVAIKFEKRIFFVHPNAIIRRVVESQKIKVFEFENEAEDFAEAEIKELEDFFPDAQKLYEASQIDEKKQKSGFVKKEILRKKEEEKKNIFKAQTFRLETKPWRAILFWGIFSLICAGLAVYFYLTPHASIWIKPRVSPISVAQNILIEFPEARVPEIEENLPRVPAVLLQNEVAGVENFPATGRRYDLTQAHGKVTIFNETSKPKVFVPSRLATIEGEVFRFRKNIIVPPKSGDTPGRLEVEIFADEYDSNNQPIGERGNIPAGTELYFPGLREESRELYYARADLGPLVGGSTFTHYFVAENDFINAEELLIAAFRSRGTEKLKAEVAQKSEREDKKYILLDDSELLRVEVLEKFVPEELMGQEVQTFQMSAKMRVFGVVFSQDKVVALLKQKILDTQDFRKKLLSVDANSVQYKILNSEKKNTEGWLKLSVMMLGAETLNLDGSSEFVEDWNEKMKKTVIGKHKLEARALLINHPQIEKVGDIQVAPFWTEFLPEDYKRIKFEVIQ